MRTEHRLIGRFALFAIWLALLAPVSGRAALVWTYDFPGTPGSGLGNSQTNPQSPNVTFGDWSRVGVSAVGTSNIFESNFWNNTSTIDTTQYESFSITAAAGYHLNLQSLTFDNFAGPGGPTKGRVQMFLNGSVTAYASFDYNPPASWQNFNMGFTPTVDANNVTTVEFRFYGWNGGTASASMMLDNVKITVAVVPEPATLGPALLLASCVAAGLIRKGRTRKA
jgi:hypothetical protein